MEWYSVQPTSKTQTCQFITVIAIPCSIQNSHCLNPHAGCQKVLWWVDLGWMQSGHKELYHLTGEKIRWESLWVKIKAVQWRKSKALCGSKGKQKYLFSLFHHQVTFLWSRASVCVVITLEDKDLNNKSLPWSLTFIFCQVQHQTVWNIPFD